MTKPDDACQDGRQRKQSKLTAALALATGRKVAEAAAEAGVSERTVYRWLRLPRFADRVAALRGEMVRAAAGRLADAMAEAADVLRGLLTAESDSVKLRAADLLLSHGVRVEEAADLRAKIEELEQRAKAREVPSWR